MWRAAASTIDITPEHPLRLGGFAIRKKPYRGIAGKLEANLLRLDGADERLVVVSIDALFTGPELRPALLDAAGGRLRPEQLLICASHTHYAPAIDASKPKLGPVDREYLDGLKQSLAEALVALLEADTEPVSLSMATGRADHHINRRRMGWHLSVRGPARCQRAPDPDGPRDERVRRIDIRTQAANRLLCVAWHYACHPTGYPDMTQVSPDFPGAVRDALRSRYDTEIPVLFFQGCSGNLRPRCFDASPRLFRRALRLVNGPQFGLFTPNSWETWCDALADALIDAGDATSPDVSGALRLSRTEESLSRVLANAEDRWQVSWQGIRLGDELRLLAVSAELVVEYGLELDDQTLAIGCADHTFGYYPRDAMLAEGGYEVKNFQGDFGMRFRFKPGLEAWFREKVETLR